MGVPRGDRAGPGARMFPGASRRIDLPRLVVIFFFPPDAPLEFYGILRFIDEGIAFGPGCSQANECRSGNDVFPSSYLARRFGDDRSCHGVMIWQVGVLQEYVKSCSVIFESLIDIVSTLLPL